VASHRCRPRLDAVESALWDRLFELNAEWLALHAKVESLRVMASLVDTGEYEFILNDNV